MSESVARELKVAKVSVIINICQKERTLTTAVKKQMSRTNIIFEKTTDQKKLHVKNLELGSENNLERNFRVQ